MKLKQESMVVFRDACPPAPRYENFAVPPTVGDFLHYERTWWKVEAVGYDLDLGLTPTRRDVHVRRVHEMRP